MVTSQVIDFARLQYFDSLSQALLSPRSEDLPRQLNKAMDAIIALAVEIGTNTSALESIRPWEYRTTNDRIPEYALLFTGDTALRMTESGYTGRNVYEELTQTYAAEEIGISREIPFAMDHLGIQLAFMGVLVMRNEGKKANAHWCQHIAPWINTFIDRLLAHESLHDYRVVAESLRAIARLEDELKRFYA